jgi:hypothetical protein
MLKLTERGRISAMGGKPVLRRSAFRPPTITTHKRQQPRSAADISSRHPVNRTRRERSQRVLADFGRTHAASDRTSSLATGVDIEMRRVKDTLRDLTLTLLKVKSHEV